jgi:hypothetical protein
MKKQKDKNNMNIYIFLWGVRNKHIFSTFNILEKEMTALIVTSIDLNWKICNSNISTFQYNL